MQNTSNNLLCISRRKWAREQIQSSVTALHIVSFEHTKKTFGTNIQHVYLEKYNKNTKVILTKLLYHMYSFNGSWILNEIHKITFLKIFLHLFESYRVKPFFTIQIIFLITVYQLQFIKSAGLWQTWSVQYLFQQV